MSARPTGDRTSLAATFSNRRCLVTSAVTAAVAALVAPFGDALGTTRRLEPAIVEASRKRKKRRRRNRHRSICPSGLLLETVTVPSDGRVITSQTTLVNGVGYSLLATGAIANPADPVAFPGFNVCDADYCWNPAAPAAFIGRCGHPDCGIGINDDVNDADKFPNWGTGNPDHRYAITFVGQGAPLRFNYHDDNYSDNVGSLTVQIVCA